MMDNTGSDGRPVRLVRFDPSQPRYSEAEWAGDTLATTRFSDGYALLALSRASFDDLNARLARRSRLPQRWLYPFSLLSIDLKPAAISAVHADTRRRLTLCAIALRHFSVGFGKTGGVISVA